MFMVARLVPGTRSSCCRWLVHLLTFFSSCKEDKLLLSLVERSDSYCLIYTIAAWTRARLLLLHRSHFNFPSLIEALLNTINNSNDA